MPDLIFTATIEYFRYLCIKRKCIFNTFFSWNGKLFCSLHPICTTTVTTATTYTSTGTTSRSYSRAAWRVLTLKYTRSRRKSFLFIYKSGFPKCEAGSCFPHEPFTLQWVWVISQKCVIAHTQGEILLMVIGEVWVMMRRIYFLQPRTFPSFRVHSSAPITYLSHRYCPNQLK